MRWDGRDQGRFSDDRLATKRLLWAACARAAEQVDAAMLVIDCRRAYHRVVASERDGLSERAQRLWVSGLELLGALLAVPSVGGSVEQVGVAGLLAADVAVLARRRGCSRRRSRARSRCRCSRSRAVV